MSKALVQQLRKQRELTVDLSDRLKITARRPTDLQMAELQRETRFGDLGQKYVIGWQGFTEKDIVSGGGSDPVSFDQELWEEFYADHPEHWEKIAKALVDSYHVHSKATEDSSKKFIAWLEASANALLAPELGPGETPKGANLAVKAWNLMGGIEWDALEIVAEIFGVTDIELFVRQLAGIRDHQNKQSET